MNKETLKEAAKRYYGEDDDGNYLEKIAFFNGAKWQKERMYSEEDLRKAFNVGRLYQGREGDTNFEKWFEQLKKK